MLKYLSKLVKNPLAAGQDGPPDLDELFKDLKNKVDNMFNVKSKNNSNGGGSNNKPTNISVDPLPITPISVSYTHLTLPTNREV